MKQKAEMKILEKEQTCLEFQTLLSILHHSLSFCLPFFHVIVSCLCTYIKTQARTLYAVTKHCTIDITAVNVERCLDQISYHVIWDAELV